jgi:hypothetical protein
MRVNRCRTGHSKVRSQTLKGRLDSALLPRDRFHRARCIPETQLPPKCCKQIFRDAIEMLDITAITVSGRWSIRRFHLGAQILRQRAALFNRTPIQRIANRWSMCLRRTPTCASYCNLTRRRGRADASDMLHGNENTSDEYLSPGEALTAGFRNQSVRCKFPRWVSAQVSCALLGTNTNTQTPTSLLVRQLGGLVGLKPKIAAIITTNLVRVTSRTFCLFVSGSTRMLATC